MFKKLTVLVLTLALLTPSIPAFAQRGGGHPGGGAPHGGPGPGPRPGFHRDIVVHRVPAGYVSLMVGALALLYCEGLFYRHTRRGYVVVQPPVGAVVPAMPAGYTVVYANGVPYYYYGYTYYTPAPNGYVVVPPPAVVSAPPAVVPTPAMTVTTPATTVTTPATTTVVPGAPTVSPNAAQSALAATVEKDDAFDIYIPNGNGSFTLVTLKQTEKGFLGPQGEFYEDHPTVEELRKRYVKK